MPKYEIYRFGADEHRAGHFTFLIDGLEAEITSDPAQFAPKALREALAAGHAPGEAAAVEADKICCDYAIASLERRIENLKKGSLFPGGLKLGPKGLDLRGVPTKKPRRVKEQEAVDAFLNRGRLKGLTPDERKARRVRKNEKRDHVEEWRERRAKLVAFREADLQEVAAQLAAAKLQNDPLLIEKFEARYERLNEELMALKAPILAASHGFQYAYGQYLTKQVDLVNDDIRIVKCMTNTTVDTERDAKDQVSDFTTLDEFDGSGYSSGGQALDSQAVNIDDANDRAEFDAADEAATLGAGTRSIQGNLLISFITNLNASLPLHWIEYASNKTPDGSLFTDVFNAEGILQAADG